MNAMKRKGGRRWAAVAALLALLALGVAVSLLFVFPLGVLPMQGNPHQTVLPQDQLLTAQQIQQDRQNTDDSDKTGTKQGKGLGKAPYRYLQEGQQHPDHVPGQEDQ
jgi:hypothetical protein